MNSSASAINDFIVQVGHLVSEKKLIHLVLSKPVRPGGVTRVTLRPLELKTGYHIQLVYHYPQRQEMQNISPEALTGWLMLAIGSDFLHAHCMATTTEGFLLSSRRGTATAKWRQVSGSKEPLPLQHDHMKDYLIPATLPWLHELGITSAQGNVLGGMQRKFKQINRFVEIFSSQVNDLDPESELHLLDMGCGKGYLTFAMHHFLLQKGFKKLNTTGVDLKAAVMAKGNDIAARHVLNGLHFETGDIRSYQGRKADILVALHACDTATDDALIHGIQQKTGLIIVAPCCQKQLRRSTEITSLNEGLYRFGLAKEKITSLLTDLIRVNVLAYMGYQVTMQEFIGLEHTPKNTMITARYTGLRNEKALSEIATWYAAFGIKSHYLPDQLQIKIPEL